MRRRGRLRRFAAQPPPGAGGELPGSSGTLSGSEAVEPGPAGGEEPRREGTGDEELRLRREDLLRRLEERIGHRFRDRELREQAFVHRSHRHEDSGASADNERLEFLGDSVLGFLVARLLFDRHRDLREGDLSRLRSRLVSASHLAGKARALGLGEVLLLGRGEEKSGGRDKESILADVYESLLAGVYLDGGLSAAERLVAAEFGPDLLRLDPGGELRDDKSSLQELLHARGRGEPVYRLVDSSGPDHARVFSYSVEVEGRTVGQGAGRSKKAAQQAAARVALERLGRPPGVTADGTADGSTSGGELSAGDDTT